MEMSKKVKFIVIYTTGEGIAILSAKQLNNYWKSSLFIIKDEDPNFPANELNTHGPTSQGWRSNRSCSVYPQELILKFNTPAAVTRIQVLGHQFMIRKEKWRN